MTQKEKIQVAISAVRSQVRRSGGDPVSVNADNAIRILDDIARSEPDLVASKWYLKSTDDQIKAFKKQWAKDIASWKLLTGQS